MPDVMVCQHPPNLSPMSTAKPRERVEPRMAPCRRHVGVERSFLMERRQCCLS
jgi:hypothetical protein